MCSSWLQICNKLPNGAEKDFGSWYKCSEVPGDSSGHGHGHSSLASALFHSFPLFFYYSPPSVQFSRSVVSLCPSSSLFFLPSLLGEYPFFSDFFFFSAVKPVAVNGPSIPVSFISWWLISSLKNDIRL